MTNVYSVKHSNGQSYDVETDAHHQNHPEQTFKDHQMSALTSLSASLASGYILHFTLKGRR